MAYFYEGGAEYKTGAQLLRAIKQGIVKPCRKDSKVELLYAAQVSCCSCVVIDDDGKIVKIGDKA